MQTEPYAFTAADVTIVTVSYNSSNILTQMLPTVPAETPVIIVNNAGRDLPQLKALVAARPNTKLIDNTTNVGFGSACNQGAHAAETEFVMLLNPDAQLKQGALAALLDAAGRYAPNTAFTPRIESASGKPHFKRRSVLISRDKWMKRGWPETECDVPVLTGSAIFARTQLFQQVEFDPRIFMYHEDDDWSLRVLEAGGRLVFVPDAHVVHLSGKSSGSNPHVLRFKGFHLARSRIFALEKHKRPLAGLRTTAEAILQLLSPAAWFSKTRRAKVVGYYIGARYPWKHFTSAEEMPVQILHLPGWKLRRELKRLFTQLFSIPRSVYDVFLSTKIHDLFLRANIKRVAGDVPRGDRVAIYLVFPKNGLLPSHKRSIAHIRESGYAPLVVSNLPLSEEDQSYLKTHSWKFLTRPNKGYDFGGYREGFLTVRPEIEDLEYLAFLNDSSWFPVPGTEAWLLQAEALGVDYAGAATSFGIRRVPRDQYQTIVWEHDTSLSEFHYCSYAILVGKKILQDPAYHRYWETYVLSETKRKVVRRGEIGMSRFAIDNGFTHGTTYDITTLPAALETCTDEELNACASNIVVLGERMMRDVLDHTLPKLDARRSPAERQETIKLIMATAARIGVSYAIPHFLNAKHQFPFLKKSPVGLDHRDSDVMYDLAKKLGGEDGEIIRAEMDMIRRTKGFEGTVEKPVPEMDET